LTANKGWGFLKKNKNKKRKKTMYSLLFCEKNNIPAILLEKKRKINQTAGVLKKKFFPSNNYNSMRVRNTKNIL
jgi:hypothetical protein